MAQRPDLSLPGAAPPHLLKRVLLLADRSALGGGLLLLLLLLLAAPLPFVGLRSLRLALAASVVVVPLLYSYRGLVIRSVPPLPRIVAATHSELLRAYIARDGMQQLTGCAWIVGLAGATSLVVMLPLLPPCASASADGGAQAGARALLACTWAGGVGVACAVRACLAPSFASLPWHDATFPAAVRLRARVSRMVPDAVRFSGALLLCLLALSPLLLALATPSHRATAHAAVDICRALPFTSPAHHAGNFPADSSTSFSAGSTETYTGTSMGTSTESSTATSTETSGGSSGGVSGGAAPYYTAALLLIRSLSWSDLARMLGECNGSYECRSSCRDSSHDSAHSYSCCPRHPSGAAALGSELSSH